MQGPQLTIDGRQLMFGTDGNVGDVAAGNPVGTWTSVSDQKDNMIRYKIDGVDKAPLTTTYSFNDSNQLQVTISVADGSASSGAFTFIGGIEVDDEHDLNYFLVDNTGAKTGISITIYGSSSFAPQSNNLSIALTGGGTAEIAGMNGIQSLQAVKNNIAAFQGDDLLIFHAETDNDIGQPDLLVVPAVINFVGNWDIQNGGLVFMSNIKTAPSSDQIAIAFGGTLKGSTVGFAYFADGTDPTSLALNIKGQHVFQSGTLNWQSSIGFSGKSFNATVEVTDHQVFPNGQTLSLTGKLTLQDADGTAHPAMDLDLEAQYSFDTHNILVFKALISGGTQPSYDLMLTGTFQYANMNLSFSLDFKDANGLDINMSACIQGDRNSIIQNLALLLDISESQASVQLNLQFSVRLDFVNGQRVKTVQPAQPASVAAPLTARAAAAGANPNA